MSVHQVEEWYVHINTDTASKDQLHEISELLDNGEYPDYEIATGYVVVDGITSHSEAEEIDSYIANVLEKR
jgi:hypothetical protein